ncbi:hypothetical protein CPB86DRAFT_823025 [Serendipita vermifera]|nr:hypothetical protein CPB86DRAFT_823025 [Serendipita vermifera]
MSSPKAVDPVAEVTSTAAEPKAKKPRGSRAKKEDVEVKHAPASTKESKEAKETKEPKDSKEKDTKTKAAPKRKATGEKHPPFEDIIRECITEATGDVREGVSRPAIKKFIESRYGLEMNGLTVSNINRAIINGEKKGVFLLPKGASGKVKLAKGAAHDKENNAPNTKSTQRRIQVAKNNAKKEKEAAKSAAKAAPPKKAPAPTKKAAGASAAPSRQPLKKASTNVKSSTTKKTPTTKATKSTKPAAPKKAGITTAERKKKAAKVTAAATKTKRESGAASTAAKGRRTSTKA